MKRLDHRRRQLTVPVAGLGVGGGHRAATTFARSDQSTLVIIRSATQRSMTAVSTVRSATSCSACLP